MNASVMSKVPAMSPAVRIARSGRSIWAEVMQEFLFSQEWRYAEELEYARFIANSKRANTHSGTDAVGNSRCLGVMITAPFRRGRLITQITKTTTRWALLLLVKSRTEYRRR